MYYNKYINLNITLYIYNDDKDFFAFYLFV